MGKFRDISIKKKIVAIIMFIVIIAVLPASIMFTLYQLSDYKKHTAANVKGIAKILAANLMTAVVFNDRETASSNLKLLDTQTHIIFACIRKEDGSILAKYEKNGSGINRKPDSPDRIFLKADSSVLLSEKLLHVKEEMVLEKEQIATLYITADLSRYYDETVFNMLIQICSFMGLFIISYMLASYFQKIITRPIINLLGLAREVAETKNYSLRAEKHGKDETGDLIDGFNDMLKEIEEKDNELNLYAYALEDIVSRRTVELNSKNITLKKAVRALKTAKDQAEAASMAKSRFLANMSHELRTPLNHIIGFTELVHDEQTGPLNETQKEYLNDALESSRHLLTLINDILDLSKIEAGKMGLYISEIRLTEFLDESMGIIKAGCDSKNISLDLLSDNWELSVMADAVKLRQIIYNLLGNALKFTPEGGKITVYLKSVKKDAFALITVSDTGIGIKSDDIQRIFSPFEQADDTASREFQGTGLGLSLTKKLVELHGGKIWAESSGENMGSAFHILLPAENSA